jgi:Transposase DDE domain group 1
VTGDGEGLVSHGGLVWLGEVADRSGLTAGLSQALAEAPRRRHDPGVGLAQVVVALADGAECLSDLDALRAQPQLVGPVPSRSSAQRAFGALGPAELRRLAGARRDARAAAWEAGAGPDSDRATLDLDATIVRTRSDKKDPAPTHKRTYGHHPHLAMLPETGEVLAGMFRPGNAGANCAADHVVVLAAAADQLPTDWQQGPRCTPGTAIRMKLRRSLYARPVIVRGQQCTVVHLLRSACQLVTPRLSFGRSGCCLSATCQHTRPATPRAAGRHLDSSVPTSWDNGVWSVVLEGCMWGPHSLHTAEVVGSNPTTPPLR